MSSVFESAIRNFLGPINSLLDDPKISEVMINGPSEIFVEEAGLIYKTECKFKGEDELLANNLNNDYQARFNAYTRQYVESSLVARAVSQQPATLQSQDGYWLLVNCKNQQVIVSESLITSLNINGRIEGDINVGTQVALGFDGQGRILSIKQYTKPLMC